jgi:O-acetyl-ADP-ribose deacetylase (regulator of RNase III)
VRDRRREGDRRRQAQFVLHAVGPVWSGEGEPELLDSCYRRSLELVRLVCFSPESRDAFAAARAEVGIG